MKTALTPLKAIRAYCLDCCLESAKEVKLCPAEGCPLHPFRMGHNPNRKGIGGFKTTEETTEVDDEDVMDFGEDEN